MSKFPASKTPSSVTFYKIKDGINPLAGDGDWAMGKRQWHRAALFSRLREKGEIPANMRFQASIASPMALLCAFVMAEDRLRLEETGY